MTPEETAFESEFTERASDEPALVVDVEGFEGPLDLLLMLARQQKVDLANISILALADQYLTFIEEARRLRLERWGLFIILAIVFLLPFVGSHVGLDLNLLPWLLGPPVDALIQLLAILTGNT